MKPTVTVGFSQEGLLGDTVSFMESIDKVEVNRDMTEGKNLITVKVNGKLIFSFDSNFKGTYIMDNNIQKPWTPVELSEYQKEKFKIKPSGKLTITDLRGDTNE